MASRPGSIPSANNDDGCAQAVLTVIRTPNSDIHTSLWLLPSQPPAVVDNDPGLWASGNEYLQRMRADLDSNLTDP
jgi:hypothetical protein